MLIYDAATTPPVLPTYQIIILGLLGINGDAVIPVGITNHGNSKFINEECVSKLPPSVNAVAGVFFDGYLMESDYEVEAVFQASSPCERCRRRFCSGPKRHVFLTVFRISGFSLY